MSFQHIVETPAPATESVALVRAAQRGDRTAFGQLYSKYAGMVYSIAASRMVFSDANDVVQETFLRALRQLRRLRDPGAFGGWLGAIARNVIVDIQRRGRGSAELVDEPVHRETQRDEAEARAAMRANRSLPQAYREPLMMRLVEGMTGPEIAERTGLTPASVRVNRHRGMNMLRQRLESGRGRTMHERRKAG